MNESAPFEWVNQQYGLKVKVGDEFIFCGTEKGKVVEDHGNYLGVRLYGNPKAVVSLHPTWSIKWLTPQQSHHRVGAGRCACGYDAYNVRGIMLDYGDLLDDHIRSKVRAAR